MRVLLLSPSTFGYEERLREAFERIGNEVVWLDERIGNGVLAKTATRLGLVRAVPGLIDRHVQRIVEQAKNHRAERIIAINPETLRGAQFRAIKQALPDVPISVYRWDSLAQKPIDDETFEVASAVYSFDPVDCENEPRLKHLPLFHNHAEPPDAKDLESAEYAVCFIGTAQLRRVRLLGRLCRLLEETDQPFFFFLKTQSPIHHVIFKLAAWRNGYSGILSRTGMPYDEVLAAIDQSAATIDIEFGRQSGLTMRTIEVAFSGIPLLTTNAIVKRYDFYAERPIFVIDEDNLALPAKDIFDGRSSNTLFEKYHIDHWARSLTEKKVGQYFLGETSQPGN